MISLFTDTGRELLEELRRLNRTPSTGFDMRPWFKAESFRSTAGQPMTIRRARALTQLLENAPIELRPNEYLVGSMYKLLHTPLPEGTSPEQYQAAVDELKAIGERDFGTNSDHMAPDYNSLVQKGIGGLRDDAITSLSQERPLEERAFLESVIIALDGVTTYLQRYAQLCRDETKRTNDENRRSYLIYLADMLRHISTEKPRSFHGATQLVWMLHFIFSLEGRGAMALGRLDQYLWPFYEHDIENGIITRNDARAILTSFWAKLEEPGIPNPIQNIAIGGQDADGQDATNDLSMLMIEVTKHMRMPASNLSARFHRDSPEEFYLAAADCIKTGIGFPAVFNDETLIPGLQKIGIPVEDARDICFVGCIETFLPGKMPPWSDSRVNILKALELALHNGVDPLSGKQVGPQTGTLEELKSFDALKNAFSGQLERIVADHAEMINARKIKDPQQFTSPLLSALTQDCIGRGRDINDGGALYADFHGMAGMGIATTTDAITALRVLVYEENRFSLADVVAALDRNFDGDEVLRQVLLNAAPKYGNGDPETGELAAWIGKLFCTECLKYETPEQGQKPAGRHVPLLAANTSNIPAGKEVGATPDGRFAQTPLSDAASPHFGRDVNGPTTVVRSLTNVDYTDVIGGTVVNMRFQPSAVDGEDGTQNLAALIRTYFDLGGAEMQFNVTRRAELEAARENPEEYRNLLVRVSGFSAYFVDLEESVKDDILARTEQEFAG